MITVEEALTRVQDIRDMAGDDEVAHSSEDALRDDVLVAIASGSPDAGELARIALQTGKIRFARWCA